VGSIPLSKIVQNLSFRYTRYINSRKKRYGHLFQGRYKAILIDADSYLLELVRYIHNNPVRAGMVEAAVQYRWSSHKAYLDLQSLPFLVTDWVLAQFAKRKSTAQKTFDTFVAHESDTQSQKKFYTGDHDTRILGDKRFVEKIVVSKTVHHAISLDEIIDFVCEKRQVKKQDLGSLSRQRKFSEIRGVIGWIAINLKAATLTEVAKSFHRDVTTLSRAVRNIDEERLRSEELQKELDEVIVLSKTTY